MRLSDTNNLAQHAAIRKAAIDGYKVDKGPKRETSLIFDAIA